MSTLLQRFQTKYVISSTTNCWNWTAGLCGKYGFIDHEYAHRISWMLFVGSIPEGLCVLHRCDNTICVNPKHLFLGTQQDNMEDRDAKGRYRCPKGEEHRKMKLTDVQVAEIRASTLPRKELALLYNTSPGYIWQIRKRTTRCAID